LPVTIKPWANSHGIGWTSDDIISYTDIVNYYIPFDLTVATYVSATYEKSVNVEANEYSVRAIDLEATFDKFLQQQTIGFAVTATGGYADVYGPEYASSDVRPQFVIEQSVSNRFHGPHIALDTEIAGSSKVKGVCRDRTGVILTGERCKITVCDQYNYKILGTSYSSSADGSFLTDVSCKVGESVVVGFCQTNNGISGSEIMTTVSPSTTGPSISSSSSSRSSSSSSRSSSSSSRSSSSSSRSSSSRSSSSSSSSSKSSSSSSSSQSLSSSSSSRSSSSSCSSSSSSFSSSSSSFSSSSSSRSSSSSSRSSSSASTTELVLEITLGNDDGWFYFPSGNFYYQYDYIRIGNYSNLPCANWFMFRNANIPDGATITSAFIRFISYGNYSNNDCDLRFYFNDEDTAVLPTNKATFNLLNLTEEYVDWDTLPAWTTGTVYDSPDLSVPLRAIINREGWARHNDIEALVFDHNSSGSAYRYCRGWEYNPDGEHSVELHVSYFGGADSSSSSSSRSSSSYSQSSSSSSSASTSGITTFYPVLSVDDGYTTDSLYARDDAYLRIGNSSDVSYHA